MFSSCDGGALQGTILPWVTAAHFNPNTAQSSAISDIPGWATGCMIIIIIIIMLPIKP
jgi:hypothetical protein